MVHIGCSIFNHTSPQLTAGTMVTVCRYNKALQSKLNASWKRSLQKNMSKGRFNDLLCQRWHRKNTETHYNRDVIDIKSDNKMEVTR